MSVISMKQLLEAGCHFGHQTRKWNPKMKKYIFTDRNNIHILNLEDTQKQIDEAYMFIKEKVLAGASVLFIGTKKQAQETVKQEAERSGMYYVNSRWLGGTLTNFVTIRKRIDRMNKLNNMEALGDFDLLPKKEVIKLKAERDKLTNNRIDNDSNSQYISDEALRKYFQIDKITLKDGKNEFKPLFVYHGFRYAFIEGLSMQDAKKITAFAVRTAFPVTGKFISSSLILNRLQKMWLNV